MEVATGALAADDDPALALVVVVGLELEQAARARATTATPVPVRRSVLLFMSVPSLVRSEDGEDRVAVLGPSQGGGAPGLVDVDGRHEHDADGDALPERLDADDDEAGLQDRGDEQAHDRAEDRALTAEDGRAPDDHGGDDIEVRQRLTGDRGGAELGQRQDGAQARHQSREAVDQDEMPVDLDADPAGGELVGADSVGVPAELGPVQDDPPDDQGHQGDERQRGNAEDLDVGVEVGHRLGNRTDAAASGQDLGQAEGDRQRSQGDDQRRDLGLGDEEAVEHPPGRSADQRREDPERGHAEPVAADALHELRGHHRREDEPRADRQVDPRGDDDESHPDAEHGPDGDVLGDQREVAGRQELASGGDAEEGDDDEEHPEDPHRLQAADALEQAVLGAVVHDRRLVLLGDDAHSASSVARLASRAPVIAPTSCSTVAPWVGRLATRVPSRMTWTRSATSSTAGMEWEIRTTAMPLSRTRRMVSSTFFVWTTPRAAVGSSKKTILLAHAMERTMAICWRWPPDIVPTCDVIDRTVPPSSAKPALALARMALSSMNPSLPRKPLRGTSRPRNMFWYGFRCGASARSWYTTSIPRSDAC